MLKYATKGSHILQAKRFVDKELGHARFADLALRAGGDADWDSVVVSAWYDVFILQNVLQTVANELGRSVESIVAEIARQNALSDLRGIYRLFMRVAQPTRLLFFTPQLWRNYVSFGDSRAIRNEPGSYVGQTDNVPAALLDWVCGDWLGFIPTGIELAGGKIKRAEIVVREANGPKSRVALAVDYDVL